MGSNGEKETAAREEFDDVGVRGVMRLPDVQSADFSLPKCLFFSHSFHWQDNFTGLQHLSHHAAFSALKQVVETVEISNEGSHKGP